MEVNVKIEFTPSKVENKNVLIERYSSFFIAILIGIERTFHEFRNM